MTSPPYWGLRNYNHPDQIGLESTPEEYLTNLWHVFDLVKPILKDVGNCFVNLGDTYNQIKHGNTDLKNKRANSNTFIKNKCKSLPDKCLCMIPQRFAWGMVERGWILRNEIIWHKSNHMPESITDRLTKSHEVVYHFVKKGKYYYDLDAIREPHKTQENRPSGIIRSRTFGYNGKYEGNKLHEDFGSPRARTQRKKTGIKFDDNENPNPKGKNPGDVWQISTKPYREAHFAVFPLKLVEKPILAGCPVGGHVLDMFGGSGTVGEFCRHNDRSCTLIELNNKYKPLIKSRTMADTPLLSIYTHTT